MNERNKLTGPEWDELRESAVGDKVTDDDRIPYGEHRLEDGSEPCPGCGAKEGKLHQLGCDHERCPICDEQLEFDVQHHYVEEDDPLLEALGKIKEYFVSNEWYNCPECGGWVGPHMREEEQIARCQDCGRTGRINTYGDEATFRDWK